MHDSTNGVVMARNPFNLGGFSSFGLPEKKPIRKRQISYSLQKYYWDNLSHVCNICGKRVTKISDAEFDHTRAYSKGGASNLSNVRIVHRHCNRIKGKKSLSETKKLLGIKTKSKKRKRKSSRKPANPLFPSFSMPRLRF